jgi:Na+-transporting methylmalonyl-CoA/oxaloacetate decarboxylase gamma subunit
MKDALYISLVGMGLVFIGLLALWAMMAIVVKLTASKKSLPKSVDSLSKNASKDSDLECKQKAAAAAVAAVLALMNTSLSPSSHQENESISPWQAAHRSRQFSSPQLLSPRKGPAK